jgi:hypothetical protein
MTKKDCHGCTWCMKKRRKDRYYQCHYSGWTPLKDIESCGIWEHWNRAGIRRRTTH